MKNFSLSILSVVIFSISSYSQNIIYAASKSGLNMRDNPDPNSAIITKIPYGEKIQWSVIEQRFPFTSEGMNANWLYVTYAGKKGYVADVYTLPILPPTGKVELKDYANKLGKVTGTWKNADHFTDLDSNGSLTQIEKVIYNNGIVYRAMHGYEWSEETIWIPNVSLEQGFVLARLLSNNPMLLNTNDKYPNKKSTSVSDGTTKDIRISYLYDNNTFAEKIQFDLCDGGCQWIEIRYDSGEISISFGSGV